LIAGLKNYDSELTKTSVPVVFGALVMLLAVFNLLFQRNDSLGEY
jgi:hypothetical protein